MKVGIYFAKLSRIGSMQLFWPVYEIQIQITKRHDCEICYVQDLELTIGMCYLRMCHHTKIK